MADLLGVPEPTANPGARSVREWDAHDNLHVTELAWDVGFGPDAHGWLVHRNGAMVKDMPGVVVFHSHGGVKSIGALRDVPLSPDTTDDTPELAASRAYQATQATDFGIVGRLASRGVAVFVPDTFSWGSRRFNLALTTGVLARQNELLEAAGRSSVTRYDDLAVIHEHVVAKAAGLIGTSYAGMIAHDDLIALMVFRGLGVADPGVVGFSGGGTRALIASALNPQVSNVVVANSMTTVSSLIPTQIAVHPWLLFTPGLYAEVDLPEQAANRRFQHLAVIYGLRDPLFPLPGMLAADQRLTTLFEGASGSYRGHFLNVAHEFTPLSQEIAIEALLGRTYG